MHLHFYPVCATMILFCTYEEFFPYKYPLNRLCEYSIISVFMEVVI